MKLEIASAGYTVRDFPKSLNIGLAIDKKLGNESKIVGYQGNMPDFKDTGAKQKEISGINKLSFGQIENSERKENPIYEAQNKWAGYGTALKPAYEPIIMARKPIEGSVADNCLKYGVGGINIGECKVGNEEVLSHNAPKGTFADGEYDRGSDTESYHISDGRYPANVITDGSDEVASGMPDGAMRYFYSAKASKKDRDKGLDEFETISTGELQGGRKPNSAGSVMAGGKINPYAGAGGEKKNIHPTVKPVELMQYLVRLVAPKGSLIVDIFNGSGSTGKAVAFENRERDAHYKYIGIELDEKYCEISKARIYYGLNQALCDSHTDVKDQIEENARKGQMSLFDD